MTTVINNPGDAGGGAGEGVGFGVIIGVFIAIAVIVLFFVYGLPAIRNNGGTADTTNINVQIPTSGTPATPADKP